MNNNPPSSTVKRVVQPMYLWVHLSCSGGLWCYDLEFTILRYDNLGCIWPETRGYKLPEVNIRYYYEL